MEAYTNVGNSLN